MPTVAGRADHTLTKSRGAIFHLVLGDPQSEPYNKTCLMLLHILVLDSEMEIEMEVMHFHISLRSPLPE